MKRPMIFMALLIVLGLQTAHASSVTGASRCELASAPANAQAWQLQPFPLITTDDGFEAATSPGSSRIFELTLMNPSDVAGWPNFGGKYYSGGDDVWVIITPSDASLPAGVTFKVVKPLETDPNTHSRSATYVCHNSP